MILLSNSAAKDTEAGLLLTNRRTVAALHKQNGIPHQRQPQAYPSSKKMFPNIYKEKDIFPRFIFSYTNSYIVTLLLGYKNINTTTSYNTHNV